MRSASPSTSTTRARKRSRLCPEGLSRWWWWCVWWATRFSNWSTWSITKNGRWTTRLSLPRSPNSRSHSSSANFQTPPSACNSRTLSCPWPRKWRKRSRLISKKVRNQRSPRRKPAKTPQSSVGMSTLRSWRPKASLSTNRQSRS